MFEFAVFRRPCTYCKKEKLESEFPHSGGKVYKTCYECRNKRRKNSVLNKSKKNYQETFFV